MTENTSPTPPGWYPAPGDPPQTHRYWDGEMWQGGPVAMQQAQTAANAPAYNKDAYADWGSRVAPRLIDGLIFGVACAAAFLLAALLGSVSETLGLLVGLLLGLPVLITGLYLLLWVPGITGQSPGRRVMGYAIVSERDGSYIGGGAFLGRELLGGLINNFCYIDYLWPLWDDKRQRLADKVVSSVAVRTEKGSILPLFPSGKPF